MPHPFAIIINPISGKSDKGSIRKERVDRFVRENGLDAIVWETERIGHATELAKRAIDSGVDRIICVGGDGTMNEVGRVIVGTDCEFGLVPMGSGNGLARHLGLSLDFEVALELATKGSSIRIDTGEADGRPFFNVMGIGFDAEVGRRFNETKARGLISYIKEGWAAYRGYRPSMYEISSDSESRSLDAYIVAVANSSQYGNNAYIAPDASLTDGKLNLVAIAEPTFISVFVLIWRMFRKKLYLSPRVTPLCSESFVLKSATSGFYHVDGEIFERGREMTIKACPKSLSIVATAC